MTDKNSVFLRIDHAREYLKILSDIKTKSKIEFLKNPYIYGTAERFLHLSIECMLDIGNHIIADLRLEKPEDNKDIFRILIENKILKNCDCDIMIKIAGFRNILVHDYTKLNRELIYI
jgi:uncharacterized protein YutE (UPF0331/DUF86 family)